MDEDESKMASVNFDATRWFTSGNSVTTRQSSAIFFVQISVSPMHHNEQYHEPDHEHACAITIEISSDKIRITAYGVTSWV